MAACLRQAGEGPSDPADGSLLLAARAEAPICAWRPSCPMPRWLAGKLELRGDLAKLALRTRRWDRGVGALRCVILALGDPLPARRPKLRAARRRPDEVQSFRLRG